MKRITKNEVMSGLDRHPVCSQQTLKEAISLDRSFKIIYAVCMMVCLAPVITGPCWAKGGNMLKTIELKGSYEEIGFEWGKQLKEEIDTAFQLEIEGTAKFFGLDPEALVEQANKLVPAAKEYDPNFIKVIDGIAKGSGRSFKEIFTLRSVLEAMFYLQQLTPMCTSFAVGPERTRDHKTIIGQNIDWHTGVPMALLKITWPNGVKQLALTLGSIWEYPLTMPENGVPFGLASNLTVSMAASQDANRPPLSIVMQKAARQQRLEQALSVMINARQNMGGFLLASAQGDMIGVEHAANQFEVLFPENQAMVRANTYLADRFRPMDFFGPISPDSYLRFARLKHLIESQADSITPQSMMKCLADHNSFPKGVCMHVDKQSPYPPAETLASIIMVPEQRIVYIAAGNPCETEYVKYEF